jgi:hypothetical protein
MSSPGLGRHAAFFSADCGTARRRAALGGEAALRAHHVPLSLPE